MNIWSLRKLRNSYIRNLLWHMIWLFEDLVLFENFDKKILLYFVLVQQFLLLRL